MTGYIAGFAFYTMAMIGVILLALFIAKKTMNLTTHKKGNKFLSVEDSINVAPRKTLYLVRAGHERFLIAGDSDRTSLISKIETPFLLEDSYSNNILSAETIADELDELFAGTDPRMKTVKSNLQMPKPGVIRRILEQI